jgi:ADP-ribose pyrophosphatase YjhB (NUDIX family)
VDIIIRYMDGLILIRRKNPPYGWALPGGFVDYGESLEEAAVREAREETGLEVRLLRQFHAYSDPSRDPRQHTISTVFVAEASGKAEAGDDAAELEVFRQGNLPEGIAFDHKQILRDYFSGRY